MKFGSYLDLLDTPEALELVDIRKEMIRQVTTLPRKGTPAAELTDREKFALAYHAGAPWTTEMDGNMMTFRTTVPVGVVDRGDGGYIVAIRQESRSAFDRNVRTIGYVDRVTGERIYDPDKLLPTKHSVGTL